MSAMLRRLGRTPEKNQRPRPRDPPTSMRSNSNSNSNSSSSEGASKNSQDRRHQRPSIFDRASTASTSLTQNEGDKLRLRNFLRNATQAGSTPVVEKDNQKTLMRRVLARSQHLEQPPPSKALSSAAQQRRGDPPSSKFHFHQEESPKESDTTIHSSTSSSVLSSSIYSSSQPRSMEEAKRPVPVQIPAVATGPKHKPMTRMERVEANPAASDFRNRLRKATHRSPDEESKQEETAVPMAAAAAPEAPSTTNSFLDSKTRAMIQQRMRERHPKPTLREQPVMEDDPDMEGYDAFFQTLQNEVHGQHSMVRIVASSARVGAIQLARQRHGYTHRRSIVLL
jgi:hypothetical protein